MSWKDLTAEQKTDLYCRHKASEPIQKLAAETRMHIPTLERRLREWGAQLRFSGEDAVVANPETAVVADRGLPSHEELFGLLKSQSYSLDELSRKYDRSKETMRSLIKTMQDAGYVITEEHERVSFQKDVRPSVKVDLPQTLADAHGQVVTFAACSDVHAGSSHSQPTNHKRFLDTAYHEYGVRVVFDPGDLTTGVGGYRGQEHDLLPSMRALGAKNMAAITEQQIWLADQYMPKYPGLTYYKLGGNHDFWHVVNSGIDAVARLCNQREDMVYLGYDVADVPLTDRVDIRLWHPGGGGAYALSYRLQKALEQTAFEELTRAVTESDNPRLRILLAGHMHTEVKFSRGPMLAAHVGCFEGQTNYEKKKALFPQIGGAIFRVWLTDSGLIQRTEYVFIPFMEIEDDWKNWPQPEMTHVLQDPDEVGVIFRVQEHDNPILNGARPA